MHSTNNGWRAALFNTLSNLQARCQSTLLSVAQKSNQSRCCSVIQIHYRRRWMNPQNTLQHGGVCATWQWFTVLSFSRWQWMSRRVHCSSSVTTIINIKLRLATGWCGVALHHCCLQTRGSWAAAIPSHLSFEIMFPENFYTITGDSEASNWILQF